ncbi:MAG: sigma-70 family RNA polymerase sigma factor [Acidobacteria bacterium]|nr:sigma-70 family RNA polymerase sigma factor [Acidobacteriota bacterium]
MKGAAAGSGGEITVLLRAIDAGDAAARDRLFAEVYEQLRARARAQMQHAPLERTLSTTALVHEAYIKLSGDAQWTSRDRYHFFALVSRAMRQILVDHARQRTRDRRGGGRTPIDLDAVELPVEQRAAELVALDAALDRLEAADPALARVVELRFFGGLSVEEVAQALGTSDRTVKRQFRAARAFLYQQLADEGLAP